MLAAQRWLTCAVTGGGRRQPAFSSTTTRRTRACWRWPARYRARRRDRRASHVAGGRARPGAGYRGARCTLVEAVAQRGGVMRVRVASRDGGQRREFEADSLLISGGIARERTAEPARRGLKWQRRSRRSRRILRPRLDGCGGGARRVWTRARSAAARGGARHPRSSAARHWPRARRCATG